MANGDMKTQTMLLEMAIKQGTATVLAGLLLWAFWAVVIEPGAAERKNYSETITATSKDNAASMKKQSVIFSEMRDTNEEIKDAVVAQNTTLEQLKTELEGQPKMRAVAMDTMTAFTERVQTERGEREILLNKILDKCTENGNHIPTNPQ